MIQQSVKSIVKSGNGALRNGHDHRGHIQEYCRLLLHRLPWPGKTGVDAPHTLGIPISDADELYSIGSNIEPDVLEGIE